VSFHLRALREAGLVRPERRGPFIYYCLHDPELLSIVASLNVRLGAKGRGRAAHPRINGEATAAAEDATFVPARAPRKRGVRKTTVAA
jgi:DNA-binding transcriptional ArsR family regulator